MNVVTVELAVEPKDEWAGGAGAVPAPAEIAGWLQDVLADKTKHEWEIGWRVTTVRPAARHAAAMVLAALLARYQNLRADGRRTAFANLATRHPEHASEALESAERPAARQ